MKTFEFHEKWKDPNTGGWKKHVYLLDGVRVTGVTTVLGVVGDKSQLIQWAENQGTAAAFKVGTVPGLAEAIDRVTTKYKKLDSRAIKELDAEFPAFREARTASNRVRDTAADKGTDVHALVEQYVKFCIQGGGEAQAQIQEDPMLGAFIRWSIENNIKFLESEKKVYSEEWFVAGTCDVVFEMGGKKYVGDVKTADRMWDRKGWWQCAAYMKMLREMGKEGFDGSCIISINKETNKLETHFTYAHEQDIKSFEAALLVYRTINL